MCKWLYLTKVGPPWKNFLDPRLNGCNKGLFLVRVLCVILSKMKKKFDTKGTTVIEVISKVFGFNENVLLATAKVSNQLDCSR